MKYIIFSILMITFNDVKALDFQPTHIISENQSGKLSGTELIWLDRTGTLSANEVVNFLSDFKIARTNSKIDITENNDNSNNFVTWKLSIIKNNSTKDFNLRINTNDYNSSNVYLLKDDNNLIKIETNNSKKYNNLTFSSWSDSYKEYKSRYDTILISKKESIKILRRSGEDNFGEDSVLRLSEHQIQLEIDRFSVYLQGIGLGGFIVLIALVFYSTIVTNEKSNIIFCIWLLLGVVRILIMNIDGDRFSEFFINLNTNNLITVSIQQNITNLLNPFTHMSFILLASKLIDIERNFSKWNKLFFPLISISIFTILIAFFSVILLLDSNRELLDIIYPIFLNLYFVVTYGFLGIGLVIATVILHFRRQPQAIYLFLCEILMVVGWFSQGLIFNTYKGTLFPEDYFINEELQKFIEIALLLSQALILNFSIIRKMKFLQMEVIAIGDKNRQILAEQNQTLEIKVKERTHELHLESQKSERLMLNILPQSIATRLKAGDESISDSYKNATILFSDLVGFTKMSSGKTAEELVFLLNDLFKRFDTRATSLGLEKIKTIGDAYMVAGGLPTNDDEHAIRVTKMALGMYEDLDAFNKEHGMELDMRIGINSGPVVAGVIGHSKFSYDLWGNTVNTASRMESTCQPGKVQVSPSTYEQIKGHFDVQENQIIECKGLGQIMTYFVK
ncbi:MAG: adenylate/guanylate cyclase domain-containing protein [Bacteroidota bacterium]